MTDEREYLRRLADYVALVYHEARNVRHLVRARAVEPNPWKYLVALPTNRDEAWKVLQQIRASARKAKSTAGVLLPFERRFRVSLGELTELYANQAWSHQAYGGNAWKGITDLVRELAGSLEAGQLSDADGLLDALGQAQHNTGRVADKHMRLDQTLRLGKAVDGV